MNLPTRLRQESRIHRSPRNIPLMQGEDRIVVGEKAMRLLRNESSVETKRRCSIASDTTASFKNSQDACRLQRGRKRTNTCRPSEHQSVDQLADSHSLLAFKAFLPALEDEALQHTKRTKETRKVPLLSDSELIIDRRWKQFQPSTTSASYSNTSSKREERSNRD